MAEPNETATVGIAVALSYNVEDIKKALGDLPAETAKQFSEAVAAEVTSYAKTLSAQFNHIKNELNKSLSDSSSSDIRELVDEYTSRAEDLTIIYKNLQTRIKGLSMDTIVSNMNSFQLEVNSLGALLTNVAATAGQLDAPVRAINTAIKRLGSSLQEASKGSIQPPQQSAVLSGFIGQSVSSTVINDAMTAASAKLTAAAAITETAAVTNTAAAVEFKKATEVFLTKMAASGSNAGTGESIRAELTAIATKNAETAKWAILDFETAVHRVEDVNTQLSREIHGFKVEGLELPSSMAVRLGATGGTTAFQTQFPGVNYVTQFFDKYLSGHYEGMPRLGGDDLIREIKDLVTLMRDEGMRPVGFNSNAFDMPLMLNALKELNQPQLVEMWDALRKLGLDVRDGFLNFLHGKWPETIQSKEQGGYSLGTSLDAIRALLLQFDQSHVAASDVEVTTLAAIALYTKEGKEALDKIWASGGQERLEAFIEAAIEDAYNLKRPTAALMGSAKSPDDLLQWRADLLKMLHSVGGMSGINKEALEGRGASGEQIEYLLELKDEMRLAMGLEQDQYRASIQASKDLATSLSWESAEAKELVKAGVGTVAGILELKAALSGLETSLINAAKATGTTRGLTGLLDSSNVHIGGELADPSGGREALNHIFNILYERTTLTPDQLDISKILSKAISLLEAVLASHAQSKSEQGRIVDDDEAERRMQDRFGALGMQVVSEPDAQVHGSASLTGSVEIRQAVAAIVSGIETGINELLATKKAGLRPLVSFNALAGDFASGPLDELGLGESAGLQDIPIAAGTLSKESVALAKLLGSELKRCGGDLQQLYISIQSAFRRTEGTTLVPHIVTAANEFFGGVQSSLENVDKLFKLLVNFGKPESFMATAQMLEDMKASKSALSSLGSSVKFVAFLSSISAQLSDAIQQVDANRTIANKQAAVTAGPSSLRSLMPALTSMPFSDNSDLTYISSLEAAAAPLRLLVEAAKKMAEKAGIAIPASIASAEAYLLSLDQIVSLMKRLQKTAQDQLLKMDSINAAKGDDSAALAEQALGRAQAAMHESLTAEKAYIQGLEKIFELFNIGELNSALSGLGANISAQKAGIHTQKMQLLQGGGVGGNEPPIGGGGALGGTTEIPIGEPTRMGVDWDELSKRYTRDVAVMNLQTQVYGETLDNLRGHSKAASVEIERIMQLLGSTVGNAFLTNEEIEFKRISEYIQTATAQLEHYQKMAASSSQKAQDLNVAAGAAKIMKAGGVEGLDEHINKLEVGASEASIAAKAYQQQYNKIREELVKQELEQTLKDMAKVAADMESKTMNFSDPAMVDAAVERLNKTLKRVQEDLAQKIVDNFAKIMTQGLNQAGLDTTLKLNKTALDSGMSIIPQGSPADLIKMVSGGVPQEVPTGPTKEMAKVMDVGNLTDARALLESMGTPLETMTIGFKSVDELLQKATADLGALMRAGEGGPHIAMAEQLEAAQRGFNACIQEGNSLRAIFVNLEQNLANINKELGTENISQERTTALAAEQREIEAAMVAYYERMALLATEAASQMHRMTDAAQQFKASVNPQPFVDKAQGEARISVENTIEELIQRKIRLEAEYDEMLERGFIIEQKQVKTLLELNDALGRMGQQQGKNNADILAKTPTEKMSKTNPAQNFTVDVLDFAMWQLEWGAAMLLVQDFFGAIHKGIATFKEYNLELTHVATITRATAAETDILGKAMLEASKISTYHYKELGESLIILGRAGFSAGESITMLPDIVHLATASMGTLREATEATVTTLEAFGLEPNKTTEVVDLLASTSITARLSMEQLSHEFSVLAPVAGAAGMSATDTATALGLMANAGLRSSVSAQALRVAISSLVNPSLKFKEQLSLVGVSAQEINPRFNDLGQILQTLREHGFSAENAFAGLDRRMVTGMVTLINNSHQWDAMRTKLSHGATAAEMAEQQMDSMSNSMTALGHSFQALAVTIGGGTNNTLVMLIHALQGIVDMLAKLSSGIPDVAKNFVLLTTVGGVALSTIKSLLTGIAAIASAKAISTVAAAAPAATGTSVAAGVVGSVASGAALGAAGRAAVGTAGRITAVEGTILGAEAVGVAGMATRGLTATDEAIAGSTPKIIALRERLSSLLAILFNPVVLQTAGLIAATYVIGSQAIKDVSGQTQLAHLEKLQSSVDNQLDSVVNITRGLNEHTTASARAVMQRQLDAGNFSVTLDKLDDWVDRFKDINNRLKDMMAEQLVNIDAGPWTQIKTYFAGLMNPEAQKESDTLGAAHLTSLLKSKHAYYQDDAAAREEAVKNTSFESNPNKGNIGLLARQQLDKDKENEDFSKLKIEEEREAFKDYMLRLKELGHKPSDRLKEQSINTETGLAQAKAYLATLHINPDDRFKWMGLGNIPEVPSMKAFDNIAFPNAPKWTGLQESTASLREKANIKSALGSPDIIKAMDAANEEEKKKQLAKTEAILAKLKVDTGTPGTMGHMLGVMQENVVKELEIWNKHSATIARLGSSTKPEDKLEVEIAKMGLEEVGPNMLLRAREYVFHALNKGISEGMGRLTQMFAGEAEFNPQGLKEVGSIALQSIGKYEEGAKKLQEELRKTAKFIDETPEIKSIAGAKALGVKFDDNGMLPKKGTEGAGILKTVEARIGFNPMLDVDPSRVKGLINSGYSEIQAQAQAAIELVGKKELFVQLGIYAVLRFKDLSDETHIEAAKFADKYFNEAQKALDTITQNKVLELKLKTHTEVFGASNATQLANLDAQAASVRALSETTIRASSSGTNSFIKLYTPNFSASEAAFKELTTEIRNSEIEYKSVVAEYKVQDDALVAQHVAKLAEISATLNKGGGNEEQVHRAMVAENASYYEKRKSQDSTYNTALEGSVKKQVDLYKKAIDDAAKLQQTGIDVYNQLQRMSQDISPHRLTKEDAEKQIMSRLSDANSAAYKGDADRVKLNIDAAEAIKSANSEVLKGDTDLADRIAASSQSIQDSMAIRKRAFLEAGKAAREVAIGTDNKTAGEVETGADNIRKGAVIKNAADLATSNSNAQDQVKTAQQRYADELAAMMTAPEAAAQALRIAHEGLTTGALEATTNLKSMSVATALFVEWLNKNLPKPEKPKVGIDKILDSSETGGTSTSGHVDVSGTVTLVGGDGKLATLTTEAMQKLADFVSDKMINGLPN